MRGAIIEWKGKIYYLRVEEPAAAYPFFCKKRRLIHTNSNARFVYC
jgi:hypothetical protein